MMYAGGVHIKQDQILRIEQTPQAPSPNVQRDPNSPEDPKDQQNSPTEPKNQNNTLKDPTNQAKPPKDQKTSPKDPKGKKKKRRNFISRWWRRRQRRIREEMKNKKYTYTECDFRIHLCKLVFIGSMLGGPALFLMIYRTIHRPGPGHL